MAILTATNVAEQTAHRVGGNRGPNLQAFHDCANASGEGDLGACSLRGQAWARLSFTHGIDLDWGRGRGTRAGNSIANDKMGEQQSLYTPNYYHKSNRDNNSKIK